MVVYNKPGRLVPSCLRTPQGTKGLVLGLAGTQGREVVSYRADHYILHEHIGNIPTRHQPKVTVTTISHWLPTVADLHHLPQAKAELS